MAEDKVKEAPEGEAAEGEDGEGGKPKKKLPMMMLIGGAAALVLVLGGGGGAAYFFLLKPKPEAAAGKDAKKKPEKKKKGGKEGEKKDDKTAAVVKEGPDGVLFYTIPDVVVNMQTADGKPTFLKLKLTFEISDPAALDLVQQDAPRLQDMFTAFLRELRPEDLAGSQGTYQLKAEILRRVNMVLAPKKIDAVLVEEMLVQ